MRIPRLRAEHVHGEWSVNQQALLGLVSLVLLGILGTVGVKYAFGEYDAGYQLTAAFDGAGQNLDTESVVKMRGVDVGQVDGIRLDDQDRAVVTLHLDPDVRVPESTVAVIRPISIFGPKFVDLVPGSGEHDGPWYEEGDEIEHTRPALELGDIIGEAAELLDAVDPQDMTTILHTFAQGVDGLDREIADSITHGQTVLQSMIDSTGDRHELLSNLAQIAGRLADRGDDIVGLGENAHRALPVVSEHSDDFAGLLEATSRLSSDLADVLGANADVMGPAATGGAHLSSVTAADLQGLIDYFDFVRTYGGAYSQVVRVPVVGESFLMATQEFLMASDPCIALVRIPECEAPAIDPGPQAAG
jgi:phospholipid/cholesterol/gamma-HCH transport system substrate-binding protein